LQIRDGSSYSLSSLLLNRSVNSLRNNNRFARYAFNVMKRKSENDYVLGISDFASHEADRR
jgi:hypothetical protein